MVDRGDLGSGLAVLGSMVGAAATWAVGLGVGTILFSVGLGAFLTYFVTARTQKHAWKREGELRKVDEIYGPVYFELNRIHQALQQNSDWLNFSPIGQGGSFSLTETTWETIQSRYMYYIVDPLLRDGLDEFFSLLDDYRKSYSERFIVVAEALLPRLKETFGEDVRSMSFQFAGFNQNGMPWVGSGGTLDEAILTGKDPVELSGATYGSIENLHVEYSLEYLGGKRSFVYGQDAGMDPAALKKCNKVIESAGDTVRQDSRIVRMNEQRESLLSQVVPLKEKLRSKTEEAWGIVPTSNRG